MEYCDHCGELVEGRFCRMCGSPTAVAAAGAQAARPEPAAAAATAAAGYGRGYGMTAGGALPAQAQAQAQPQGAEATRLIGPVPGESTEPIPETPSEFENLFRSEDGANNPHQHTQMLPPVQADYRMPAPGGARPPQAPAQRDRYAEERDEGPNRTLVFAMLGAVMVAAVLIIGLLYLGNNQNGGSPTASATGNAGANANANGANPTAGVQLSVPTTNALPTPSSAAPSSAAASPTPSAPAGAYSGDSVPLGPGSAGSLVSWVQHRLQSLGDYHGGDPSGHYGQATALAVQQFQASASVTGDPASVVGQHTYVALIAAGSQPALHVGSRSADVNRLDEALNAAENAHLQVGSKYTMSTLAAVMRYQTSVGLAPTGQVDASLWQKLQSGQL